MNVVRRIIFGRSPRRTTLRILLLAIVSLITFRWVLIPIRAEGISMQPTFAPGELKFVSRFAYSFRPPARGDIVAIRLAGESVVYVKRIVGLPGERIAVAAGQVRINGTALVEPYVRQPGTWAYPEVVIAPAEYFVVGDNRSASDFGRVEARRILGRVLF